MKAQTASAERKGGKVTGASTCLAGVSKGEGNGHEVQGLKWFEYRLANQWEVECGMCKSVCSLKRKPVDAKGIVKV